MYYTQKYGGGSFPYLVWENEIPIAHFLRPKDAGEFIALMESLDDSRLPESTTTDGSIAVNQRED